MRRRDLFLPSKCQIWGCPDVKRGAWLENLPSWLPFDSQFSQKLGEFAVFIWVLRSYGSSLGYSMVCIEEVGSWFRELYPPKRLELMTSLLQMCLPLELRFIGSYVEDLAKKDYYYLRDAENRANDPQELKKLVDIFDRETRAKMTTYLALMHSSNTVCSSALYTTLTCILLPALERNNHIITNNLHRDVQSDNFCSEIFLMLTMAAYHPSFSFRQRHRLSCELHSFQKLFEDQLSSGSASVSREHSPPSTDRSSSSSSNSSSSGSVSGSQHPRPTSTPVSTGICNPETNAIPAAQSNAMPSAQSNAMPPDAQINATPTPVNNGIECSPTVSPTRSPVYVQNVEVKGCQVRDRRSEFVIQVTWSDGQVVETCRTYQQLQQFHAELLKLFPKDAAAHKQERMIPFLPPDKGPSTNHTELEAHIKKYIGQLSVLQDHIVKCDHVTAFFRSTLASTPTSPVVLPAVVQTDVVTSDAADMSAPSAASLSSVSTSPLTITVESGQMSGGHSPRLLPAFAATNSPTSGYSSVGYPMHHQGSPSSSGSSPLVSPSSSGGYPAMPTVSPRADIASWLKTIRLHKYTHQLCRFSFDELALLSEQQLEQEGLTVGARKKFTTEMIKWRPAPNGIIFDGSCPQSPFHTPPHSYTASPLAELHQGVLSGNMSGVDSSSVGSECSSPPNSPILERKQRSHSMSSDETDKENPPTDVSEGLDVSDGLLPTPTPIMPLHINSMLPDQVPLGMRPNGGVLGPPPGVRDGPPSSAAFMSPYHRAGPMDMKTLQESMLHQYPPGVRPLYSMFDNSCPPRGPPLRTIPRGPMPQNVQPIRTLPLPIHTSAAPVMPSPKGGMTGAGVVFENGHHQPLGPNQSFTYVPNHSHGPQPHAHPPPLGAVPHNHPPTKVNGQYADSTMTAGLTSSTDTPAHNGKGPVTYIQQLNSSPGGGQPLTTVSGPSVLTWPSSVNTMASTSLTYSIVQMPPSHDSNGKTASLQAPTMSTHSSPGGSTYSTPPPGSVGLQRAKSSTPPMAPSATSVQHHPASIATASATPSNCVSCGCNCNNSATPTPTPTPPPPPQQQQQQQQPPPPPPPTVVASASMGPPPPPPPPHPAYNHLWYMQQAAMWHNSHLPYLAANSNGLITHSMPFPQMAHTHHHPPTINGLNTDVLYHPHNLWLGTHMAGGNGGPYAATGSYPHHNAGGMTNGSNGSSSNGGGKKSQCYNCGQTGHWAADCKEPTMDAMSHSGTFHLKFRPKSQDTE